MEVPLSIPIYFAIFHVTKLILAEELGEDVSSVCPSLDLIICSVQCEFSRARGRVEERLFRRLFPVYFTNKLHLKRSIIRLPTFENCDTFLLHSYSFRTNFATLAHHQTYHVRVVNKGLPPFATLCKQRASIFCRWGIAKFARWRVRSHCPGTLLLLFNIFPTLSMLYKITNNKWV